MQMPALLVAILLAGGNPVWDQQRPKMVCAERAAITAPTQPAGPTQKLHVAPACSNAAKPVAEAVKQAPVRTR